MRDQNVDNEMNVRAPFEFLLAETGRQRGWTLVPELSEKAAGGLVRPDGTLRDSNSLPRGYWEAKDTKDDLDLEIQRKIARGYRTSNTIFEDTEKAVLYQNKQPVLRINIGNPRELADLLNKFYSFTEPDIQGFEEAIDEFGERVPELAGGLAQKVREAHKDNPRFIEAFEKFFHLCQTALNPNIRIEAVDEMLVQHLLTERLIRTIFDNPEFTKRNAIAQEVERVIEALVSQSFNRSEYLKSLDRFYLAIESAARTLPDFSEKQHFLNRIYERFFQGYSVKVADTHGIVYTPQPIVNFMSASVSEVLEKEFGKDLSSPDVYIIDPCTGTGNFVVNLLRRISRRDLPRVYRDQLFANEVMLLPYYIAALNIEHAYYELTDTYEPFEGLCFVDTLDLSESSQPHLYVTEKNAERVERQRRARITIVIGNPPYNMGQQNENDNNKNRQYKVIDKRIKDTYAKDSKATLKTKLYDPYVKFFRWAIDRLQGRDGIVCFVSNNSFVDQRAFDGMQQHLLKDFTDIYHVDLHGNVQKNPRLSGTTHNVFGIKVGVGITVAVRSSSNRTHNFHYYRVPEAWRKEEKLSWLNRKGTISKVEWSLLPQGQWLKTGDEGFEGLLAIATKEGRAAALEPETIFKTFSLGVSTNRDDVAYGFQKAHVEKQVGDFCEHYNAEVDRYKRAHEKPVGEALDAFLDYSKVKWSRDLKKDLIRGRYAEFDASLIRTALYRPFTQQFLYFADLVNDTPGLSLSFFPKTSGESRNRAIVLTSYGSEKPFMVLATGKAADLHLVGAGSGAACFPFSVYESNGETCHDNITDWSLARFRKHYANKKITKWDIFYYIYAILHNPEYRTKYSENLKRDLPRIPYAADFQSTCEAGKQLAELHINYEKLKPYPMKFLEDRDSPFSYRVEGKMRLSKERRSIRVNPSLTLSGIPEEAFEYRLGNRSAIEWVVDQYQAMKDTKGEIYSDPNRTDDPEYIVRLIGQVIRVSLETIRIVKSLPEI